MSEDPEVEKTTEGPVRPAPRPPHHGPWFYIRAGILVAILAPVLFAIVALFLIIGREVDAPSWVVSRIEAEASAVLGGGSVDFDRMTVTVGRDLHPTVVLEQVSLRDAEGAPLARVPRIETLVSPRGLILRQEVLVQEVRVSGAEISLRRAADGSVALSFGPGAGPLREAPGLLALMDEVDRALEGPTLEALEQVTADGVIVNFADARAGRSWTLDGGQIDLDLRGGENALRADLSLLSGRSFATGITISYASPRGSRAARMGLSITDGAAADLGSQVPALGWLGALDAPLTGNLRAELDSAGALGPVSATLEIGPGAVQPTAATRPIPFETAKAYLTFDPAEAEVRFDRLEVQSDWGGFAAEGVSYLRDLQDGLPGALIAQFDLGDVWLNPDGVYPEARQIDRAALDFRLRLDPFLIEVGQFLIAAEGQEIVGAGRVRATDEGWHVAADLRADVLRPEAVMSFWPEVVKPRARTWFAENLIAATISDLSLGFRFTPNEAARMAGSANFADTTLRYMKTLPVLEAGAGFLTIDGSRFVASVEEGYVMAPQGGTIDLAGSVFSIADITRPGAQSEVDLTLDSTITAALSILDLPPFEFLTKAGLPVDLADGRFSGGGTISLPLRPGIKPGDVAFNLSGDLRDVRTDRLVPGRTLAASRLGVTADNAMLSIGGALRVGQAQLVGDWTRAFDPDNGGLSRVSASVTLDPAFLSEFNIGLPDGSVGGSGTGMLDLELRPNAAPEFVLRSDLVGLRLGLPAIGWSKPDSEPGVLEVTGTLGPVPSIDRLTLDAGGLRATGDVALRDGGGLDVARFDRVIAGGWLDGPVVLRGRGPGAPVGVEISGGTFDLRRAQFGDSAGQGGPMAIQLDRLQISDGIALTGFAGEFDSGGGFSGQFTARLNGGTPLRGSIVPYQGRSAVRILSDDAGGVFRSAGLLENAQDGAFEMVLLPTGAEGTYDGTMAATDLRVRDAPALAALLDAISVVGLLGQLDGQGLSFTNVDASFRITPDRITVTEGSAVGPGLGISMDGIYMLGTKRMEFQGVISPIYLLNGIGSVLTRPGEGLFGFTYRLDGVVGNLRVSVNPLSALTPGMFREIFRRPPPDANQ